MLLALLLLAAPPDTIRLEVGSKLVNGRVYAPHKARVRVHGDSGAAQPAAEWINELTLGDSAGRPVMRWVTTGKQNPGKPDERTWELRQTYDAETLAPLAYSSKSSAGTFSSLNFNGNRVTGTRKLPSDPAVVNVDYSIERRGFIASASDLVPLAVGLKPGSVMTAPVWSPGMKTAETRIFTVIGEESIDVEGTTVKAWKVEERHADGRMYATWWLLDHSPYMVFGEVVRPDGKVQRMSEVAIP